MTGHRIKQYDGEAMTHERVVKYLKRDYPGVIFRTDYAAGIKLTKGQAAAHARLQYGRGWPDLFIFEPVDRKTVLGDVHYHGLALELKAANVSLKKRDTTWASDHIAEQAAMLRELEAKGYAGAFACGYEEACRVLDWYLTGGTIANFADFIPVKIESELTSTEDTEF